MISANMYSDPHDNIHDSWGYGVTSESDTAMGYMSVGGSLTYYTADTKDEVKQMGSLSYGRQSDLAMNSYKNKATVILQNVLSVYGLAGIGLHLLNKKSMCGTYQKLINLLILLVETTVVVLSLD